ncbi:MAG: putative sensor with domain [Paenibacillaceae bacterium]|nr:putative sensor with domain [Paenibacillaceae bacterium]
MKGTSFSWIRKSMFAKFSLSFISVGLIPLFVLSYISLNTFGNYMEKYTLNNFEQMLLFAGKNVDDLFMKYNNISKLMYSYGIQGKYGQLGEAIADQISKEDPQIFYTVDDFLRTVLYTDSHIKSAIYVFPDREYQDLNKENNRIDFRYAYPSVQWIEQLANNRQDLTVIPTHPDDYYIGSNAMVLTLGRNLIDVVGSTGLDGRVVGSLLFDVSISAFEEIFHQLELNPRDSVYVINSQGAIIYSNKPELIGQTYAQVPSDDFIYRSKTIPKAGWTVIGEVHKDEMFSRINGIKNTIALVIMSCIISLIIVAVWFSQKLSKPIRTIIRHMARVESGRFDTQVEVRSNDEIGMLARGFNKMTDRLQNYIEEVYVAQIKQKQAELYALKSQIRPHYLYNTLEVIRMSAVGNDDDEVADMIMSLSHQLKYVLDYGEETVSLQEEKNNIEQYFRLMLLRYGEHRVALEMRLDGEVLGCSVPKLSLQPLVENAIYHGIMPKAGKGTVRIEAQVDADKNIIAIIVDDDGVGMEPELLEQFREKLRRPGVEQNGGGIGVKNVHDRIAALYGAGFGIEISSSRHIGTSVRMMIPYENARIKNPSQER